MLINIDATGIISQESKRAVIDGVVFFGRKKSIRKGTHDPNAETTTKPVSNKF